MTIVSVALPPMARDLHTQLDSLQWVVDAYALALAALLLVSGSLADRFGRRRLFQLGLALFAVSSLACALAPNAGFLIAARTVQGAGAAAMFATNTALLNHSYSGRDRSVAFGVWGAINGAAAAVAPVLGGLLIAAAGWRAIFLVNLPIAVVAGIMTQRVVAESRGQASPIDWAGAASFTVSAASLTYALIHGGDSGWAAPVTLASFAVAAAALLVFVLTELRVAHPLLDLSLFRRASFSMLMVVGVVMTGCAFAPFIYTQLWLQSVLGLPAIGAGLVLLPMAGVAFVVSAVAGRFLHGVAARWPLGAGLLFIGAGSLLRAFLAAIVRLGVAHGRPGGHRDRGRPGRPGAGLRRPGRRPPPALRHGQRRGQHVPPDRLRAGDRRVRLAVRQPHHPRRRDQRQPSRGARRLRLGPERDLPGGRADRGGLRAGGHGPDPAGPHPGRSREPPGPLGPGNDGNPYCQSRLEVTRMSASGGRGHVHRDHGMVGTQDVSARRPQGAEELLATAVGWSTVSAIADFDPPNRRQGSGRLRESPSATHPPEGEEALQ